MRAPIAFLCMLFFACSSRHVIEDEPDTGQPDLRDGATKPSDAAIDGASDASDATPDVSDSGKKIYADAAAGTCTIKSFYDGSFTIDCKTDPFFVWGPAINAGQTIEKCSDVIPTCPLGSVCERIADAGDNPQGKCL